MYAKSDTWVDVKNSINRNRKLTKIRNNQLNKTKNIKLNPVNFCKRNLNKMFDISVEDWLLGESVNFTTNADILN